MNDERILEFLRERGRAPIPADLRFTITSAIADTPQRSRSSFTAFAPALVGVAGVAVAVLLAVVIGQSRDIGPSPAPSPSAPTAVPSPSASAVPATSLVNPGDVMVLPALDVDGEWGTIRLERGEEVTPVDPRWSVYDEGSTIIEIHATFTADRATTASIDGSLWHIRIAGEVPNVTYVPQAQRNNPDRPRDEQMGTYQMTPAAGVREGWLAFEIPADATGAVTLEYRPPTQRSDGWEVVIREGDRPTTADGTDLVDSGSTVVMPIRSSDGASGTVRVIRLMDAGGFPLVIEPSSETHFFVEIFVSYDVTALPDGASIGPDDWSIERADGTPVDAVRVTDMGGSEARNILNTTLGGAELPVYVPEGHLIFAVPRDDASAELVLAYEPQGTPPARFALRAPGSAPPPVAAAWPLPELVFQSRPGMPIAVLESAEADALFAETVTCTNPVGGYSVTYPSSWHTNDAALGIPSCSRFGPVDFSDIVGSAPPAPIQLGVFEGAVGFIWVDLWNETVTIDGFEGRRWETGKTKEVDVPTDTFQYSYLIPLDANVDGEGRKLRATTDSEWADGYELNRAVLDRIMASLRFDAPQE